MPDFVPHKSGIHRYACCVLYRRLLQHTSRIPNLDNSQITLLKAIIKARFCKNARLQPFKRITSELELGYRTIRVFAALNKTTPESATRIQDFLSHQLDIGAIPKLIPIKSLLSPQRSGHDEINQLSNPPSVRAQSPTNSSDTPSPKPSIPKPQSRRIRRTRNPHSIYLRPYPTVSRRRHVPRLISANGFPFLRIKKPQPVLISRMIRCTVNRRNAMNEKIMRLEDEERFAATEDRWDALVGRELGERMEGSWDSARGFEKDRGRRRGVQTDLQARGRMMGGWDEEGDWTEEIRRALWMEKDRMHGWNLKRSETARRMWEIVKAERALVERGRRERRRVRDEARTVIGEGLGRRDEQAEKAAD